ncbi:MAG: CPBP family glutamic-type intramembrane protease [Gemmatimonadota bacterium]|nr:CPBP family glutamic-type intramembrane protease [Gemmatimonadota bacterium]
MASSLFLVQSARPSCATHQTSATGCYGWLYLRTANLWVPVIAHAVTNAILGGWVLVTGSWTFW